MVPIACSNMKYIQPRLIIHFKLTI